MREFLVVFRETYRQVMPQRGHIFIREIVFANKHENHTVDFMYRIYRDARIVYQLVIRVSNNGIQVACFQVKGKTVIPAADSFLIIKHRQLGQTYTTVTALVLQRKHFAVGTTQYQRNACNLDSNHLVLWQLVRKQRRIPVVNKAPGCILIWLILALGFGIVGALFTDAVYTTANGSILRHFVYLLCCY